MPVPAPQNAIEHWGLALFVTVCFVVLLFGAVRAHREQRQCEAFCEASGSSVQSFVPSRWYPARCSCQ